MAAFVYQGKTAQGKIIKGQIDAASENEARVLLRAQRIIPIKVVSKEGGPGAVVKAVSGTSLKTKPKDLQIFSRQFATMINSGIPIVQALDILYRQTASPGLRACLKQVKEKVEGGQRLSSSIEGYPRIFDRLYVSLVQAGEEGGVLDTILNRLAAYIEKNNKLVGKVKGAMWYPAAIMAVAAMVITGLMVFVIPKFEKIFTSMNQQLPAMTQTVIDLSHFFVNNFIFIVVGVVASIYGLIQYYRSAGGRITIDRIAIRAPIFGPLIQKSAIARFTRTMSTMLGCGVGILESLQICSNVVGNNVIERALLRCRQSISEGKSITQPLAQEPFIPSMVTQMIGVGEATGNLDTMLSKIADFYEEEVDAAVEALTSLMEPLMMVLLGGIIAVLVIAMYLPIFNLAGAAA